jgi:hypothetical protein
MGGVRGTLGEGSACRDLIGKPEVNRRLGRPRHRWENIKTDVKNLERDDVYWTNVASDEWRAVGSTVLNLRVP